MPSLSKRRVGDFNSVLDPTVAGCVSRWGGSEDLKTCMQGGGDAIKAQSVCRLVLSGVRTGLGFQCGGGGGGGQQGQGTFQFPVSF